MCKCECKCGLWLPIVLMALVTCAYVFGLIWVFGHLELFTPSYVCCDGCNNAYLLTAVFTVICGVWMALCWRFYNNARDKADMEEMRMLLSRQKSENNSSIAKANDATANDATANAAEENKKNSAQ